MDFVSKFLLQYPEANKELMSFYFIGQAFSCFSDMEKKKPGWNSTNMRAISREKANQAIEALRNKC